MSNATVALAPVDTPAQSAPVALIERAIADKADPAQLRELLAVRREWEQDEARKAFHVSVTDFQRRAPIVTKGDKAYDKDYARMDRIWREVRPLLTELGLSVTWQVSELKDGICHIEGTLRHRSGHGERLVYDVPVPDLLKGQNKAQQMGSATTYAKRYAFCGALGIVTGDDDDGHAAATSFITREQAATVADKIDACKGIASFNEGAFWKWLNIEYGRTDLIPAARLSDVLGMLDRKLKGGAK